MWVLPGGIAVQSNNQLFALANDFFGASQLYSLDLLASSAMLIDPGLDFGLAGGLTWDATNQLLYALGSDFGFVQTLVSIDPTVAGSATPVTVPLGMGFVGGVDIASTGEIFAIGNGSGVSELVSLSLGGGATSLFGLAPFQSYNFSALTSAPAPDVTPVTPVTETPPLWLLLLGLWAFVGGRRVVSRIEPTVNSKR